jgi:O-glycosyl hydrolase
MLPAGAPVLGAPSAAPILGAPSAAPILGAPSAAPILGAPSAAPILGAQQSAGVAAQEAITVTVQPGARQTFRGMGISQNNYQSPYNKLTPARRALLAKLLFGDLRLKTLRMWWDVPVYAPASGPRNPAPFAEAYITSGIIADARAHGVTTLLLAPDHVPPDLREDPAKPDSPIKASAVGRYAALIAEFIQLLRDRYQVRIDATGVANEPPWFTPETMVATVRALRAELDKRGLKQVRLVATEQSNNDATTDRFLEALKADGEAWAGLSGIATHSYNMAARKEEARFVEGPNGRNLKEFWITESGGGVGLPVSEPPLDERQAASMASRFLNDMNHRVTHWIWFLGAEEVTKWPEDFDNVQRLIEYQPQRQGDWYLPLLKYYYFKRLSQTFDPEAVFRATQSSLEGEMTWTYGRKPRLTAAAARNPDGTWAIALSNYTADTFTFPTITQFDRDNTGQAAQTFTVTLRIPELAASGAIPFRVRRNSATLRDVEESTVTMQNGVVTIPDVSPLQLVTLRTGSVR